MDEGLWCIEADRSQTVVNVEPWTRKNADRRAPSGGRRKLLVGRDETERQAWCDREGRRWSGCIGPLTRPCAQ